MIWREEQDKTFCFVGDHNVVYGEVWLNPKNGAWMSQMEIVIQGERATIQSYHQTLAHAQQRIEDHYQPKAKGGSS